MLYSMYIYNSSYLIPDFVRPQDLFPRNSAMLWPKLISRVTTCDRRPVSLLTAQQTDCVKRHLYCIHFIACLIHSCEVTDILLLIQEVPDSNPGTKAGLSQIKQSLLPSVPFWNTLFVLLVTERQQSVSEVLRPLIHYSFYSLSTDRSTASSCTQCDRLLPLSISSTLSIH
jgi:hypothetical protein